VSSPFVIALDGPAASGKSSIGLGTARQLGFRYFDTGLLYRALTWLALQMGVEPSAEDQLASLIADLDLTLDPIGRVFRRGKDITNELQLPDVNATVSAVSAHARVRQAMRPVQRNLIIPPGLVMAGRDIGTVIVPEAPLKIWLNASLEERARRRAAQTGETVEAVLEGMRRRDELDASRDVAPMARAADAITIDTDGLTPQTVIDQIVSLATARGAVPVPEHA
jgi:cytidylate kinase